jgi:hypothetical protein
MKIMNTSYKPVETSIPIRGRVIMFWTSTTDEASTRALPESGGGGWSPNHFVPLLQPNTRFQETANEQINSILEVGFNYKNSFVIFTVIL